MEIAYRLLAVRMRSRRELAERLQRRGIPDGIVNDLLAQLSQRGLIDDTKFAQAWVRGRQALRPSGAVRLRYELTRKGVSREIIDRAIAAVMEEQGDSEFEVARAVARDRGDRYRGLPRQVADRRLSAYLQRRGFSADVIARVLRT
ncbi:MAG TPA: regulatory protein RecX [bacterium]|nr:regulatory protein RecX [bacterium]